MKSYPKTPYIKRVLYTKKGEIFQEFVQICKNNFKLPLY